MFSAELIERFRQAETPLFYYDTGLLRRTLDNVRKQAEKHDFEVHYAVKANANDEILKIINSYGFGADCVSGNEIKKALKIGFPASKVVFAGVGKSDKEINFALDSDIFCFNSESEQEVEIIGEFAAAKSKNTRIALRINPNVKADTHEYITTGTQENKFGLNPAKLPQTLRFIQEHPNLEFAGLHFHIGSQILVPDNFKNLCHRANEINNNLIAKGFKGAHLNVGGGLGIDYENPGENLVPDFETYFNVFADNLDRSHGQQIHFELGRAIVGQCGTLISRVLYVKEGAVKRFTVLDAGMTELIRPALYKAYHQIENITSEAGNSVKYDVVGPICESTDCFLKDADLPETRRGDLIAIRSAGAYAEVMTSNYNLRDKAGNLYAENESELIKN